MESLLVAVQKSLQTATVFVDEASSVVGHSHDPFLTAALGQYLDRVEGAVSEVVQETKRKAAVTQRKRERAASLPEGSHCAARLLGDMAHRLLVVPGDFTEERDDVSVCCRADPSMQTAGETRSAALHRRWALALTWQESVLHAVASHRGTVNRQMPSSATNNDLASHKQHEVIRIVTEQGPSRKQLLTAVIPNLFRWAPVAVSEPNDADLVNSNATRTAPSHNSRDLLQVVSQQEPHVVAALSAPQPTTAAVTYATLQCQAASRLALRFAVVDTKLQLLEDALPRLQERLGRTRAKVLQRCNGNPMHARSEIPWIRFEAAHQGVVRIVVRDAVQVDLTLGAGRTWAVQQVQWSMAMMALFGDDEEKETAVGGPVLAQLGKFQLPVQSMMQELFAKQGFESGCVGLLQAVSGLWCDIAYEQCRTLVDSLPSSPVMQLSVERQTGSFFAVTHKRLHHHDGEEDGNAAPATVVSQFICEDLTVLHVRTIGTEIGNRMVRDAVSHSRKEEVVPAFLLVDVAPLLWDDWSVIA